MAHLDLDWVARMNKRPRDEPVPEVHSHQCRHILVPASECQVKFNPQDPDQRSILKYVHQQEQLLYDLMKPYMQHWDDSNLFLEDPKYPYNTLVVTEYLQDP